MRGRVVGGSADVWFGVGSARSAFGALRVSSAVARALVVRFTPAGRAGRRGASARNAD